MGLRARLDLAEEAVSEKAMSEARLDELERDAHFYGNPLVAEACLEIRRLLALVNEGEAAMREHEHEYEAFPDLKYCEICRLLATREPSEVRP